jgi:hypothetical protein
LKSGKYQLLVTDIENCTSYDIQKCTSSDIVIEPAPNGDEFIIPMKIPFYPDQFVDKLNGGVF